MARQAQQEAEAFLQRVLRAGPLPARQVWEAARQEGHAKRTYDRARRRLQIQTRRIGWSAEGWWIISLPSASCQLLEPDLALAGNRTPLEHGADQPASVVRSAS